MKAKYLNQEIRKAIRLSGLTYYQVANGLGIANTTFSTWLQSEMDRERKRRVMEVVGNYEGKRAEDLNTEVRAIIRAKGLKNYEVANQLGIRPASFSRWLQSEMSQERKELVLEAIENIKE